MIVVILLVAMGLRFFNLGLTPAGLYADETSLGYNAYALSQTGRDEYGKGFPALIKSFGDYKAPVYTYLLVPVYKIWGMNPTTTRSVSAAAGVMTVVFLYALIRLTGGGKSLAGWAALILATNPWHLMLSRAAIEANVALLFLTAGIWAFFKFIKGNRSYLILSALMTAVALTAYHAERLILPVLFMFLGGMHRQTLFNPENRKWLVRALGVGLVILMPTLAVMGTPGFFARAKNVTLLTLKTEELWGYTEGAGEILNSRALLFGREWLAIWATYFSPKYLFGSGNPDLRNTYPDVGPFLIWQLPLLIIGIAELIKLKRGERKSLTVLLLAVSPLAATLVREPFAMIRALPLVMPVSILIGMGIEKCLSKWKLVGTVGVGLLVVTGLGRIYLSADKLNDFYRYQYWDFGVEAMVEEINRYPDENIQVDNWRAEIYSQLLFFLKYDPERYQADNGMRDLSNYYNGGPIDQVRHLGRIMVKPLNWNEDADETKIVVGSYKQLGDSEIKQYCLTKLFTIRAPDNVILFTGARTNPEILRKYQELNKTRKDEGKDCWGFVSSTNI